MNEKLLQFIWKHVLFARADFITFQDNVVRLISPGMLNQDAGADFLNARMVIDGMMWAGNIEVDVKSSNWYLHGHDKDPSHTNTILHVVYENDLPQEKLQAPLLELKSLIAPELFGRYEALMQSMAPLHCRTFIPHVEPLVVTTWLERMAAERLENKYQRIKSVLESNRYNWEETFYILLSRNFGFNLNADAFEQLARTVPYRLLLKARSTTGSEEAVLMGAAGFLKDADDEYGMALQKQYAFFARTYKIKYMPVSVWKFARTRPANFPTLRIAQLAALYHTYPKLFSICLEAQHVRELYPVFERAEASSYWETHYRFGAKTANKFTHLGMLSIESLLINAVIPVMFSFAKHTGDINLANHAIGLLQQVSFENNRYTRIYSELQLPSEDAMQSQGYLHLYKNYCRSKRCLECGIGFRLLKNV